MPYKQAHGSWMGLSSVNFSLLGFTTTLNSSSEALTLNALPHWGNNLRYIHLPVSQDLQDQEEAREEDEAEQAYPPLDPHENRQYNQVQCEAQALASY
ncbi:hypothetical protein HS088_TW04G00092 [Tripterygium wilfordii]|uniref:Uncharacterized protein n=1 Tax=Tripterygium wilfordii TaxID=458696 RepID=A0A7J7DP31_TRIWF|nr:hypothetical protein HS088_TW04G00092 [Tripterygium wilfordii]